MTHSRIDLEWMQANSRVLIANLSGIGEQESKLLTNLLMTKAYHSGKQGKRQEFRPVLGNIIGATTIRG